MTDNASTNWFGAGLGARPTEQEQMGISPTLFAFEKPLFFLIAQFSLPQSEGRKINKERRKYNGSTLFLKLDIWQKYVHYTMLSTCTSIYFCMSELFYFKKIKFKDD